MINVYLNTYEKIILNSILEYEGDLIQLRNYLKIFSDDFISIYNNVFEYYEKYKTLPNLEILKREFNGIHIENGNSVWALDEQNKYFIKQVYKDIVLELIEELEIRDYSHDKLKNITAKLKDIGLTFTGEKDYKDLKKYLNYKTRIIKDLKQFSLWLGQGVEIPSFNMIFAETHGGKTLFSYKLTAELYKIGKRVLFLSPEMNWKKSIIEIYQYIKAKPVDKTKGIPMGSYNKILKLIEIPTINIADVQSYILANYEKFDFIILDSYYEFAQGSESAGDDNSKLNDLTSFLVKIPRPIFVTTQAKPEVQQKKLADVSLYDTYYNKKGSVAGDYVGFIRFDKFKGIMKMVHLKGRNVDFESDQLEEISTINVGYHNGIFMEMDATQNKYMK